MSSDSKILSCCLYGGCVCPPADRDRVMFDYCSLSDNGIPRAISRQQCKTWIEGGLNQGNETVKSLVSKVCNSKDMLGYPLCQEYCSASGGACDRGSVEYCLTAGEMDPYCRCMILPVDIGQYNPACFWSPCRDTPIAYKTLEQSRQAKSCPPIMDCRQFINIDPSARNNVLDNVKLTQTCIQNVGSSVSESTDSTTNDTVYTPPTRVDNITTADSDSNAILIILLLILFVLISISIGTGIYFYKKNKQSRFVQFPR